MKKVSVIIPTYNRARIIQRSIQSALNQAYSNLEVLVIDDGSIDNTKDIVEAINDPRIKYIWQENAGACAARNHGIREASGDYIAFLDSDDIWESQKVELQIEALDKYGCDICITKFRTIGYSNKQKIQPKAIIQDGPIEYKDLICRHIVTTSAILAKANVFKEIFFDEKVKKFQDYEWVIRAGCQNKVCALSYPLLTQYLQKDSITVLQLGNSVEMYQYFKKKYQRICDENPEFDAFLNNSIAYHLTISGEDASGYYYRLFKKRQNIKVLIKCFLSKMGILRYYYLLILKLCNF